MKKLLYFNTVSDNKIKSKENMPKFTKITAKHPRGKFFIGHREIIDRKVNGKPIPLTVLGVYVRILTLAPTWNMNLRGLATVCGCSVNTVMEAVKKLKELGYIEQTQSREQGRITGSDYIFKETVNSDFWSTSAKNNKIISNDENDENEDNGENSTMIEDDPHLKNSYLESSYLESSYLENCDVYIGLNNKESNYKESNNKSLSKGQIKNLPERDNFLNNNYNNFNYSYNTNTINNNNSKKENKNKNKFPNSIPKENTSTNTTEENENKDKNESKNKNKSKKTIKGKTKDGKDCRNKAQIKEEQEKQSVTSMLSKEKNAKPLGEQTEEERTVSKLQKEINQIQEQTKELQEKQRRRTNKEIMRANIIGYIASDFKDKQEVQELFRDFINSSYDLGKPITIPQYKELKKILFEFSNGDTLVEKEIIRTSLVKGWKSFYKPHEDNGYGQGYNYSPYSQNQEQEKDNTDIVTKSGNSSRKKGKRYTSVSSIENADTATNTQTGVIRDENGNVIGFK